jgi:hypothetical protein
MIYQPVEQVSLYKYVEHNTHGVISQKTPFFIVTAVKTSNLTLLKFYKAVALSTVLHGAEDCILNEQCGRRTGAAEVKFLLIRAVAGCRRRDQTMQPDN